MSADLAALLRDLRKRKGMTLSDLAQRIGRSTGFLSQVERGLSQPTVADLTAISTALGVPTTWFYLPEKPRALPWVTRPNERRTLRYEGGVTDVLVSPALSGAFFMLESHLAPNASSGEHPLDDRSEQGGFVLEGELAIWYGEDKTPVILTPGDAFQLPPHAQFRYANLTSQSARILWVFT